MGEWVDTLYGKRFKEEYGTTTAFFKSEPNEKGERFIPSDVLVILLEDVIYEDNEEN